MEVNEWPSIDVISHNPLTFCGFHNLWGSRWSQDHQSSTGWRPSTGNRGAEITFHPGVSVSGDVRAAPAVVCRITSSFQANWFNSLSCHMWISSTATHSSCRSSDWLIDWHEIFSRCRKKTHNVILPRFLCFNYMNQSCVFDTQGLIFLLLLSLSSKSLRTHPICRKMDGPHHTLVTLRLKVVVFFLCYSINLSSSTPPLLCPFFLAWVIAVSFSCQNILTSRISCSRQRDQTESNLLKSTDSLGELQFFPEQIDPPRLLFSAKCRSCALDLPASRWGSSRLWAESPWRLSATTKTLLIAPR